MRRSLVPVLLSLLLFGCTPTPQAPKPASSPSDRAAGLQVYTANCATCHQVDGSGVPNMQPALLDDDIVAGDPNVLIRVVLKGPAAVLPAGRANYGNVMPDFHRLTDQQIANVLTYIRHDFGHQASEIESTQVQAIRAQLGL